MAKASLAFASLAFVDLQSKNWRYPMRKRRYLRYRRVLRLTKEILVIIFLIVMIADKFLSI